ncbi:hypothetical protein ABZ543_10470 [Streptomyces roseifaciens]
MARPHAGVPIALALGVLTPAARPGLGAAGQAGWGEPFGVGALRLGTGVTFAVQQWGTARRGASSPVRGGGPAGAASGG